MYHLLKKYRRRLLAIATALLMVAFLIPTLRGTGNNDYVVGTVAGKKVYRSNLIQSHNDWSLLRTRIFRQTQRGLMPAAFELGESAVEQIENHQELFFLLTQEAFKQGVYISDDTLRELHDQLTIRDLDMSRPDVVDSVNHALRSLLMVQESFNRAISAIRVSEPLRDREIALRLQQVKLSTVDFKSGDFASQVNKPTAQEIQEQFDKYKDIEAGATNPRQNPFGFGYRYPDRVQLQYISVPTEDVRKAVEASRTPDRWRVDAIKYYRQHQGQFTITTQPATDGMTLGTTKPALISTTQPFEKVEKDAIEAVVSPEIEKLQSAIVSKINSTLASDYNAFKNAKPGEQATSSLGVAYNTFEYIQKLSDEIQKQFKVKPTIGASGALVGARDLEKLGAIARSFTGAGVPFPAYATLTDQLRKSLIQRNQGLPAVLQPWQPSQTTRDFERTAYIFRVTAFDPAHTPRDVAEITAKIEADLTKKKSMELAQAAAEKLAQAAQVAGLQAAAKAAGKATVDTDYIGRDTRFVNGLHLSDAATGQFISDAMEKSLQKRAEGSPNPSVVVPAYADGRVLAVQLRDVKSSVSSIDQSVLASYINLNISSQFAAPLQGQWFDFAAVSKRVGYEPYERKADEKQGGQAPSAPGAPLDL